MKEKPLIYWEYESQDAFSHKISGTLDGYSLTRLLQGVYPDAPITLDQIMEELRSIEVLLVETVARAARLREQA